MKTFFNFILILSILAPILPSNTHSRNILLVTTDDMTSTVFDQYPTHPFFKEATSFKAISSFPVCGPARAALLTGLRPDTTKIYNFETYLHIETMFTYFKSKGYDTFVTGKVFHTLPADINKQFEYGIGELTEPRVCTSAENNGCPQSDFFCHTKKSTDQCSINAISSFFKSRIGNPKSWIAGVGFHRPHLEIAIKTKGHSSLCNTYVHTQNYQTTPNLLYSLSDLQHTDLLYMRVPIKGKKLKMSSRAKYPYTFFTKKNWKTIVKMRQAYCDSSTETIEYFLGIVDLLGVTLPNEVGNTDIIFVADHGFQIGQRGMLGKNTLYPESTNIPMFIKTARGEVLFNNGYVSSIDVFPTLVQLHGLGPVFTDGVSLTTTGQLAISQYPRCQQLGIIQTEDCMTGPNSCFVQGRPQITYMGYLVVKEINGVTYRFSEWFPFNEIRTCGWPYWSGIPSQFIDELGSFPVWNVGAGSCTNFTGGGLFKELYTVGPNGLINSRNLVSDAYSEIVNSLNKLIIGV